MEKCGLQNFFSLDVLIGKEPQEASYIYSNF